MANPIGQGGITLLQGTVNTAAAPLILSDFRIGRGVTPDGAMPREFTVTNNGTAGSAAVWVGIPALNGTTQGVGQGFPIAPGVTKTFTVGGSMNPGAIDVVYAWLTAATGGAYAGSISINAGSTGGG